MPGDLGRWGGGEDVRPPATTKNSLIRDCFLLVASHFFTAPPFNENTPTKNEANFILSMAHGLTRPRPNDSSLYGARLHPPKKVVLEVAVQLLSI